MLSAVLIVAVTGFILEDMAISGGALENVAGAAVSLDTNAPTYSGVLYLLEEACVQVEADGVSTCNELCEGIESICVPLEDNCDEVTGEYLCHCCSDLSE